MKLKFVQTHHCIESAAVRINQAMNLFVVTISEKDLGPVVRGAVYQASVGTPHVRSFSVTRASTSRVRRQRYRLHRLVRNFPFSQLWWVVGHFVYCTKD